MNTMIFIDNRGKIKEEKPPQPLLVWNFIYCVWYELI